MVGNVVEDRDAGGVRCHTFTDSLFTAQITRIFDKAPTGRVGSGAVPEGVVRLTVGLEGAVSGVVLMVVTPLFVKVALRGWGIELTLACMA
jgi:hypothetical protein